MGLRFSKSIILGNLLKVNLSKSGISASIGKKGASINVGKNGTYLNLSPTIAGIAGTGVSYRKKITGGYNSLLSKLSGKNETKNNKIAKKEITNQALIDDSTIEEFEKNLNESINIHKLAEDVLTEKEFEEKITKEDNDSIKEILQLSKDGDEDIIEQLVGSFMMNLDFAYPVKANYELENSILYVDLDLPEIEDLDNEYPTVVKEQIINKKKTKGQLKQEYAYTVMSLSAYLSAEFFNLSSFIKKIIISGFTTKRNSKGDFCDEYLYSVKYEREIFENVKLKEINNIYEFILKFENRINLNTNNFVFKSIEPYEMPSVEKANSMINEAISGLKELGYKNATINEIIPALNEIKLNSSGEYLKEALRLLANK